MWKYRWSFFTNANTLGLWSRISASNCSHVLPVLPSRVTWETSDLWTATTALRVMKSTQPVELTGLKRSIIGRSRSLRFPACLTIASEILSAASTWDS